MLREVTFDSIPAAGEPLKQKIAEENQRLLDEELQARIERSRAKLPFWKRLAIKLRYKRLSNYLNRQNYNQMTLARWEKLQQLQALKRELLATKNAKKKKRLTEKIQQLKESGSKLHKRILALQPIVNEFEQLGQQLKAHQSIIDWERRERENRKQFRREAATWEAQIKAVFHQSARLHHRGERNGKEFTQIPLIERILFKEDRVLFKVKTTTQNILERFIGRWHSALPYNVDITALTCEETLKNLSASCRRVVNVEYSNSQTQFFYSISRLDSPDGIPKRFLFSRLFEGDFYPKKDHASTPWAAGVTQDRKIEWFNFEDHPNVLVAGSPGGGKSNHLNQMIATIALMNSPAEVQLKMVDLKGGIEFVHWEGLAHLTGEIVKTPEGVLDMLKEVYKIIQHRFKLFAPTKAKKLSAYNKKAAQKLPRLIIFIDEMATLVGLGQLTNDIQDQLRNISSQGRALGVHLVLATQHPSVDVLPGWVKTNMSMRIASKMPSHTASGIILDTISAALLPVISGRMVFSVGRIEIIAQSPYISDEEIARAVALSQQFEQAQEEQKQEIPANIGTFGKDNVLDIALELGGKLSRTHIVNRIGKDRITEGKLREMIESIIEEANAAGKIVTHRGIQYRLKRDKRLYLLEAIGKSDKTNEDTDTEEFTPIIDPIEVSA